MINYKSKPLLLLLVFVSFFCVIFMNVSTFAQKGTANKGTVFSIPGIDSIYSEKLAKFYEAVVQVPDKKIDLVDIQCISTAGDELYIGVKQEMVINSSLKDIVAVWSDFDHAADLYEDLAKVKVVDRSGKMVSVFAEQKIPVFENVKQTTNYYFEQKGSRWDCLAKLKESNQIKYSDGIIKIIEISKDKCYFYEIDFINTGVGGLAKLAPNKVWEVFTKGLVVSDLAMKLKAENPSWTYEKIKKEAENLAEKVDVKSRVKSKISADSLFR